MSDDDPDDGLDDEQRDALKLTAEDLLRKLEHGTPANVRRIPRPYDNQNPTRARIDPE